MHRVFISYRISDCTDLAGRLDADLADALGRDEVFRDKTRLEPGQTWPVAIERTVASCRALLALIGPSWQTAAFTDGDRKGLLRLTDPEDWVRREIALALDAGCVVIPVYLNGADKPSRPWLARVGLERLHDQHGLPLSDDNYDTQFAALLVAIHRHCPELAAPAETPPAQPDRRERRDFYQHVALPPNYVPRDAALAAVAKALLSDSPTIALTSGVLARPAALHGMGGIGKSVLARAACDLPEVRAAFPDGILWTALGQTPNVKTCLREWIGALGVTVPEAAPTVATMAEALARALAARACLLILDDLWYAEHFRELPAIGPRCRLLITTRNAGLARQFGARIHPVEVMNPEEAQRLLEIWADGRLADTPAETKEAILVELGGLPLAIKLAGAQLQRMPAAEWLTSFEGVRGLEAMPGTVDRDASVHACFQLSMRLLDERSRQLYAGLGIFREDEPIPLVAVTKLASAWLGAKAGEARRLCLGLADLALVELAQDHRVLLVHDLLCDMIVEMLGTRMLDAHRALLTAYAATRSDPRWASASDDGYLYDHLAYHLAAARDVDNLRGLFDDDQWMWARLRSSEHRFDGYVDDLDRFWQISTATALDQIARDAEPAAIADCLSCALIQTSINSGTSTYTPALIARAVELGLWSVDRALSTLEQVPNRGRRFDGLVDLLRLSGLPRAARDRITQVAFAEIDDGQSRSARQLGRLGGCVDEAYVAQIMSRILLIDDGFRSAQSLVDMIPRMTDPQLLTILEIASALPARARFVEHFMEAPWHTLLAALAPRLPEDSLQRALTTAIQTEGPGRISALLAFVPRIDAAKRKELVDLAWYDALAMPATSGPKHGRYDEIRAWGLAQLVPFLCKQRRREASAVCLRDLRASARGNDIILILRAFGGCFEDEDLAGVVEAVHAVSELDRHAGLQRIEGIALIGERLHAAGMNEPIAEIVNWVFQHGYYVESLTLLPTNWRDRILDRLLSGPSPAYSAIVVALLPYLAHHQKAALLRSFSIGALLNRHNVDWNTIAHDLPQDVFDELVSAMLAFPDVGGMSSRDELFGYYSERECRLMQVARRLSAEQVVHCLHSRGRTRDEWPFVELIVRLRALAREPAQAIDVALDLVLRMPAEYGTTPQPREQALATLAQQLRPQQLARCVEVIESSSNVLAQVLGFASLLPHLRGSLRDRVLESARTQVIAAAKVHDAFRAPSLAAILPSLPESERESAAEEVVEHLQPNWEGQDEALIAAIPFLPPGALVQLVKRMLELLGNHDFLYRLPQVVQALVPQLSTDEVQVLASDLAERANGKEPSVDLARLCLVPYLTRAEIDAIVITVLEYLQDTTWYYHVKILEQLPPEFSERALSSISSYETQNRIDALRILIPKLEKECRDRAIEMLLRDISSLPGLDAITALGEVSCIIIESAERRRRLARLLVERLYVSRSAHRGHLLYPLAIPKRFLEELLPDSVLGAFVNKLVDVFGKWNWP